jgi:hypothetical protein
VRLREQTLIGSAKALARQAEAEAARGALWIKSKRLKTKQWKAVIQEEALAAAKT